MDYFNADLKLSLPYFRVRSSWRLQTQSIIYLGSSEDFKMAASHGARVTEASADLVVSVAFAVDVDSSLIKRRLFRLVCSAIPLPN